MGTVHEVTMEPDLVSFWVVLKDAPANGVKSIEFDLLYDPSEIIILGHEVLAAACFDFSTPPSYGISCLQPTLGSDLTYLRFDAELLSETGDVVIGLGPRSASGKLAITDGDEVEVPLTLFPHLGYPRGSAVIHAPPLPAVIGVYFDDVGTINETAQVPGPFSFWVVMTDVPDSGVKSVEFDILVDPNEITLLSETVYGAICSNDDVLPSILTSCFISSYNDPHTVVRIDAELLTSADNVEIGLGPRTLSSRLSFVDAGDVRHDLILPDHMNYSAGSAVLNPVAPPVFVGAYFDEAGTVNEMAAAAPGLFSFWVVVDDVPATGISGLEFDVMVDPSEVELLSFQALGGSCLDFSTPPSYLITCPDPSYGNPIAYVRVFADLLTSTNDVVIGLGPRSSTGNLAMSDGNAIALPLTLTDHAGYPAGAAVINPAVSAVHDGGLSGTHLTLSTGSPNPFGPRTTFAFALKEPGDVTIEVYDLRGRRVARIRESHMVAGPGSFVWDGRDDEGMRMSAGVYFIRVKAGNFEAKQRVTMLR